MLKRPGWLGVLIVGVIIGLAAGGAVVWATIPDNTTGTITACYPTSGTSQGALRVINYQAGTRCKAGEALLQWPSRSFRWRGAWTSTTAYTVNDVVRYNGSAYIAYKANTNIVPTNTAYWNLMVAQGVSAPAATIGSVAATVSTTSTTEVDLGGPTVTVTVPPSGFVTVYSSADITVDGQQNNSHGGRTQVFEGNQLVALGGSAAGMSPGVFVHASSAGTTGTGIVETSPGVHTFSLRYARSTDSQWTGSAYFNNRKLVVKPVS